MSLRESLRSAVARCTPLHMQPATFTTNRATCDATTVQTESGTPHETWLSSATKAAKRAQPEPETRATRGAATEVTQATKGNFQSGALTAHRLTAYLLQAAMRVCDRHGDHDAARQEMRDQCMALPPHLQADLLEYFTGKRPNLTKGRYESS